MLNRRTFIKKSGWAAAILLLGQNPIKCLGINEQITLSILYTNLSFGHTSGSNLAEQINEGFEKLQATADLIKKIRTEENNVLLFDVGDFFLGSFSLDTYSGTLEIEAMNKLNYDAVCIGERELEKGLENLSNQLNNAKFNILCSNYSFTTTNLQEQILPYKIIKKEGVKIGIIAAGADLKGLINEEIGGQILYHDAVKKATETAGYLKKKENCDFVICLSRLDIKGGNYNSVNNKNLAKESEYIDLIIGGHSKILLNKPMKYYNKKKQEVLIVQADNSGSFLGRIDYAFSSKKNILSSNAQTVEIGK